MLERLCARQVSPSNLWCPRTQLAVGSSEAPTAAAPDVKQATDPRSASLQCVLPRHASMSTWGPKSGLRAHAELRPLDVCLGGHIPPLGEGPDCPRAPLPAYTAPNLGIRTTHSSAPARPCPAYGCRVDPSLWGWDKPAPRGGGFVWSLAPSPRPVLDWTAFPPELQPVGPRESKPGCGPCCGGYLGST